MDNPKPLLSVLVIVLLLLPSAISLTPVSNCAELQNITLNLAEDYDLTGDIDCTGVDFDPIGIDAGCNPFTGTFSGGGYTIYNLTILSWPDAVNIGMFCELDGANVTNFSISGANVSAASSVGILAGNAESSNISYVGVDGRVNGTTYVGGLIGYNYFSTINHSHAEGIVTGVDYVAGLVGYNYYLATVDDSYTDVDVTATGNNVGGLIGKNNRAHIEASNASGDVTGVERVGGLIGRTEQFSPNTIVACSATGDVVGTANVGGLVGYAHTENLTGCHAAGSVVGEANVGGLVGYIYDSSIDNSYALGGVNGTTHVGGLVGFNYHSSSIDNSYASGDVNGTTDVGGLVGYSENSFVDNSYASGGVNGTANVGGLVGYIDESTIDNTYATGSVSCSDNYCGGLVGETYLSVVNNSYAIGNVTCAGEGCDAGGLVGENYMYSAVDNSYATGVVNGTGNNVGGLVGHKHTDSPVYNSYWLNSTANNGLYCVGNDGGGDLECATETEETYFLNSSNAPMDAWDFDTIWDPLCDGLRYPPFQWQGADEAYCTGEEEEEPLCGDGVCDRGIGETCTTCRADCVCDNHHRESTCDDAWECTSWSTCRNDKQTRDCFCSCDRNADCTGDDDEEQPCTALETCSDSWSCTSWGECVNGLQSRVCSCSCDDSDCTGDSSESKSCSVTPIVPECSLSWSCSSWGECVGGTQTRDCNCLCDDDEDCTGDSSESKTCTVPGSGLGSGNVAGGTEGTGTGSAQGGSQGSGPKTVGGQDMTWILLLIILIIVGFAIYFFKFKKPKK